MDKHWELILDIVFQESPWGVLSAEQQKGQPTLRTLHLETKDMLPQYVQVIVRQTA